MDTITKARELEEEAAPKKNTPLTRAQKRANERLQEEEQATYNALTERFLEYFTQSEDPEGEAVQDKIKQISTQWRLYCQRKGLIPALFPMLDNYMDGLLRDYLRSKEEPVAPVAARVEDPQG